MAAIRAHLLRYPSSDPEAAVRNLDLDGLVSNAASTEDDTPWATDC